MFAQEEETEITIAGIDLCLIFSSILVIILSVTLVIGFRDIMEKYEERLAKANEDEKIYKKELIKQLERIKKKNKVKEK